MRQALLGASEANAPSQGRPYPERPGPPHREMPAPHFVIPAPHFVTPAPHFVIPAKAGIQRGGER